MSSNFVTGQTQGESCRVMLRVMEKLADVESSGGWRYHLHLSKITLGFQPYEENAIWYKHSRNCAIHLKATCAHSVLGIIHSIHALWPQSQQRGQLPFHALLQCRDAAVSSQAKVFLKRPSLKDK